MNKNQNEILKLNIRLGTTLLSVFLASVFLVENKSIQEIWLSIVTIMLILLSIALNVRKKVRLKLRTEIYKSKIEHFLNNTMDPAIEGTAKWAYQLGREDGESFLKKHANLFKDKSKDEIRFYFDLYFNKRRVEENLEEKQSFQNLITEGLMNRLDKIHEESFKKPLNEKFSNINLFFDKLSFSFANYISVLSLLGFSITIILLII